MTNYQHAKDEIAKIEGAFPDKSTDFAYGYFKSFSISLLEKLFNSNAEIESLKIQLENALQEQNILSE